MTTVALHERITVGGVDLATFALLARVVDVDDLPDVRGEDVAKTGLPGRQFLGKLLDSRTFQMIIVILGQDADGAVSTTPRRHARTNLDTLKAVLALRTQQTVTRLMPDGTTRSCVAECRSLAKVTQSNANQTMTFLATFTMADPYWYGASTTGPGSQTIAASPTDFTFTNPGNVRSHRMTIAFTGAITNPRLTNLTNGSWVDVVKVVAATKQLVIDPYAFTALYDGVDTIGTLTHGPTVAFLEMSPGANSMRVTAGTAGGSLLLTVVPAYL